MPLLTLAWSVAAFMAGLGVLPLLPAREAAAVAMSC